MSKNAPRAIDATILTVGGLITELCRWPDQAKIRFRCPATGAGLSVAHIEAAEFGVVDIQLHADAETAPVVPA